MYYIFSIAGISVYSGVSTVIENLCDNYFIPYLLFLTIYTFSFIIAINYSLERKYESIILSKKSLKVMQEEYLYSRDNSPYFIPDTILKLSLFSFFAYYIIELIYPEMRLLQIFHPSSNIDNIFARRDELRGNALYQAFYYLNMMSFVLVFIYAYKKFRQRKWWVPIVIFGLWYYLQIVVLGYFSRNEMLIIVLYLVLMFDNRKRNELIISKRLIVLGVLGFILIVPFLNSYELIRMGGKVDNKGVIESIVELFTKEATYGKYYDFCASYDDQSLIIKYFVWLITLPLPSAIFGKIKSFGLGVNTLFTEAYTGIKRGSYNYSVILPSIFGEALLIYGRYFYWIHAGFLGLFFGWFCKRIEKNSDFTLLNLYFAVLLFLLGRGGSGAVIPNMINYMVFFWLVNKLIRVIKSEKENFVARENL